MRISGLVVLLLSLSAHSVSANVGIFTGFGHSVALSSTEKVQMVSEEVTIIPGRGRFLFRGGVQGMDRVEYHCLFVLKNLQKSKVNIQVGFPLNSQFLRPSDNKEKQTRELVTQYNFIAQTDEKQYSVRYVPGDNKKKLQNLFLWDMSFAPLESKTLQVSYSMPISMTLASSAHDWQKSKYTKDWYRRLESCRLEFFGYVTETGKSWAGNIEKATFKVYIEGFEDYITNRPLFEGVTNKGLAKAKKKYPVWEPTILRIVEPDGWQSGEKGFLIRTFENYQAESNIMFYYYLLSLPKTKNDAKDLISHLTKGDFSNEDIQDLSDILREFNGEKTNNTRIEAFLKNQKWYEKEKVEKIPAEIIDYVENFKMVAPEVLIYLYSRD